MQSWHTFPFFRLIIPFAAGILVSVYTDFTFESSRDVLFIVTIAAFVPILLTYFFSTFSLRWLSGLAAYIFLSIAGYSLTAFHTPKYDQLNISNFHSIPEISILRIAEPPIEKANSMKAVGEIVAVYDSAEFIKVTGNVIMYFEKSTSSRALHYGDEIMVNTAIQQVDPPGNPNQFNYKSFLANSGIYHQVYVRPDQWSATGEFRRNPFFRFAYAAREKMLKILEHLGLDGDEYAVVSAILLGYDDLMDRELRNKYASAGALHVLCVSGLHVGIIFMFLSLLFMPLNRRKSLRIVKLLLVLLSIWTYALITGMTPSVMRASVMFSLFAVRDVRKDKSNPYNILAASAFILLTADPYMITKIGFQLSYAAVIAIISLFQPIYNLWPQKNILLDYFWKLTVVSFAAQIGTFPFAIYYFHQFPVYFFLTNIIVIPLVWLILNTGILVLMMSVISNFVAINLSIILYYMLAGLNAAVSFINALPGAAITGLVLSLFQLVLLYGVIITISRALLLKHTGLLLTSLTCVLVLLGSFIITKTEILSRQKMIVYQVNGHSGVEFIIGENSLLLADTGLLSNKQMIDFNISSNWIFSGIKHVNLFSLPQQEGDSIFKHHNLIRFYPPCFYTFGNLTMAMVDEDLKDYKPDDPIHVDVLILRDNPKISIPELMTTISFNHLVIDASNSFWTAQKWKAQCDSTSIRHHNIRYDGYFTTNL
ncbi:MAG: competence protein ComEC family protein [Bacteroidales bacterium]|nr:competence protein ComEC family protein [Bacteroidales bacterium]